MAVASEASVSHDVRSTPGEVPVLECRNLCISYFTRAGEIPAVVDFNMKLMPGEAQGIVGEFGLRQVDRRARHHAVHGLERACRLRRDPVRRA